MNFELTFTPFFKKQLKKIKKKDKLLYERLIKKVIELRHNPEHYKPLRNNLQGKRRIHINDTIHAKRQGKHDWLDGCKV